MQFLGRYSDGQTASSRDVYVYFSNNGVHFVECDHENNAQLWPISSILIISGLRDNSPLHLSQRANPNERLTILSHEAKPEFLKTFKLPRFRRPCISLSAKYVSLICLLMTPWLILFCPPITSAIITLLPIDVDQAIGKSIYESFMADKQLCVQPDGLRSVDELQKRLSPDIRYQIAVVHSPVVNAISLPGGYIVIYSGLLEKTDNVDALAGIVAHEMAHIKRRHGMTALARAVGLSILTYGSWYMGAGQNLISLGYSRHQEYEADRIGADILVKAGISPTAMAIFFEARSKEESTSWAAFMSTHPGSIYRAKKIEQIKVSMPTGSALTAKKFKQIRHMCDGPSK